MRNRNRNLCFSFCVLLPVLLASVSFWGVPQLSESSSPSSIDPSAALGRFHCGFWQGSTADAQAGTTAQRQAHLLRGGEGGGASKATQSASLGANAEACYLCDPLHGCRCECSSWESQVGVPSSSHYPLVLTPTLTDAASCMSITTSCRLPTSQRMPRAALWRVRPPRASATLLPWPRAIWSR